MKVSELSVRQPVTISMLYVLVCVVALIFVPRLGVALYPTVNRPVFTVGTFWTDVGPEEVEQNVTRVLESRLSVISGLKEMSSTSALGRSFIRLTFGYDVDLDEASNDIKEVLTNASRALPDDCDTPMLWHYDANARPIMRLTVSGDMAVSELRVIAEDTVAPLLERIEGVATADVSGGAARIVRVDVNENRLRAYKLTLSGIASALSARNLRASGGSLLDHGIDYEIYLNEAFTSLEDIRHTVVSSVSVPATGANVTRSHVVRLEDVAEVYEMNDYSGSRVYIDGVPGLYISVSNETDSNSTTVARSVREGIPEVNSMLPLGVSISILSDDTTMISDTMSEVYNSALQGGLLAMLIILLFLRSMKGTIIIGFSMPISILVTLLGMSLMGLTLNIMTMTGLILGIGMIVDSSIVVLDNIHRYREQGENAAVASIHGSGQVVMAITASTMTTLCVFLPVLIYKADLEMLGQMFGDLVVTVVLSLSVSLFVAMTLVPAMSGSILKLHTRRQKPLRARLIQKADRLIESALSQLEENYAKAVAFVLHNRLLVMTLVVLIMTLSLMKFVSLGMSFAPESSSDDMVTITMTLPVGTNRDVTEETLFLVQDIVKERVDGYSSLILTVGRENRGNLLINLPPLDEQVLTPVKIRELVEKKLATIPDAVFTYSTGRRFRPSSPVDIRLSSEDISAVEIVAADIVRILEEHVPEVVDVETDFESGLPQYTMVIDRDRASALGVSVSAVSSEIRAALNGLRATSWQQGNDDIDIMVHLPDLDVASLSDLGRLMVNGKNGSVMLDNLVTFRRSVAPTTITREEGMRINHVTANIRTGLAATQVQPLVEKAVAQRLVLPESVSLSYAGEAQDLGESGSTMILVVIIAIFLVFIVMAAQFESLVDPFIIFMSIPLLSIGVVWLYVLSGQPFSLFSAVGVVALVGIVVNNGIVLVDYTNSLVKKKVPVFDACVLAAKNRLRPILMTTLTTVFAMVPMAFFPGDGGEMMQPIGITMVGGLLSGAVMTLFVTPIMYSLFNKRKEKRFDDPESLQNMLAEFDR